MSERKPTLFRLDKSLLKEFQKMLLDADLGMAAVLEGWIREYVTGGRGLPGDAPLPTEGRCPICESTLKVTPKGMALVQIGPLEPMAPGEIPEELMGLVRAFLEAYSEDEIFRGVIGGILEIRARKK